MKIAVSSRNPKLYSTRRLVEAAKTRGHEVTVVDLLRCFVIQERPVAAGPVRKERRVAPVAILLAGFLLALPPMPGSTQTRDQEALETTAATRTAQSAAAATLRTLDSFVDLRKSLLRDMEEINRKLASTASDMEKKDLKLQLDKLDADLRAVTANFENVAAGVDATSLRTEAAEEFNFQREVLALLKPALDEMKEMTAHVRQKSDLKDEIVSYEERLPVIASALANVHRLMAQSKHTAVTEALQVTADKWQRQQVFMQSELEAARLQLEKLIASEVSLAEASESYLKSFFQARGLYLTEAMLVILGVVLLSRLSHRALVRFVPGFRKTHRSFRTRLVDLIHRMVSVLLVIIGPMIVFYVVEDWVLFSLSILLLLGIAWTLRQTLPRYVHQVQIFLNIGSVREGERLLLDGLPWRVRTINVFCTLVNPVAELTQRVPIESLVGLKSILIPTMIAFK